MNLNQVTIPVSNISKSIHFYQTLGLNLIVESPQYARFECPDGDATFSLHQVEKLPQGTGAYIYFECETLDKQVDDLKSKGIKFEESPSDKSWLWREARLKDLDNNQIILYFAGKNRKNPPWQIQS